MRNLLPKNLILLMIGMFVFHTLNAQKTYISFQDATQQKMEGINTTPKRSLQDVKSNNVEINYTFSGAYVSDKDVESRTYNYLHISGFSPMTQVGAPALPAHNDIIAIPRGAKAKIIILEAEFTEHDGFMIHPTLKPARDTEGSESPEFEKDEKIYGKNEFFPKNIVEIGNINLYRGTGLAVTQIRPVQFNPVTGKIRTYTSIKYRLETVGGEANFDYIPRENSQHFINLLKRSIINSDMIPDKTTDQEKIESKAGAKEYIIVTHSEYLTQANALADWKRQLGYSVEVVSASSWTAAEVKTAIHDRYSSWTPKPDYFVIIGDHDGSYAVPGEIHQDPSYGDDFATDLYAACMDGGSDHVPDMAHGRISVSSSAEATVVINKIINYEKTPPTTASFYSNMLNCAQWQDDDNDGYADRRFCHTSEDIRDYMQDEQGYTSTRVYYRETGAGSANVTSLRYNDGYYSDGQLLPAELRDASFNWSGGATEITSEIDAGKFMVFHRDHGYSGGTGWAHPYYTTTTMTSLANGVNLPVIFSMNCHTGEFQLTNCFTEKLIRMENKGAVGVVGAAYYSYSGYNDAMSIGMIDAIWSNPGIYPDFGSAGTGNNYTIGSGNDIYTMGDVMNQGLHAMIQNFADDTYTFELYHYFGDPAMKIWTANPNDNTITVTHNATIDCAGTSFSISGSTANAVATLVYNNELLAETTLDGSGAGTLTYAIVEPGSTVTLTISKHNSKPYTADLTLTGSCSFPPSIRTDAATFVAEDTATLNGEILNDFGSAITASGFIYSTSPSQTLDSSGVTQVQTSPIVTSGAYSENITGLNPNTRYYSRAYATNANGTSYGDDQSFKTLCGVISSFPYTQDFDAFSPSSSGLNCMDSEFEEEECWINDKSNDDTDWTPISGITGFNQTGPSSDHTGGGNYLYIESFNCYNHSAYIESPVFDFSTTDNQELVFYYHMYGIIMGSLKVDLHYNGSWHNAININWTTVTDTVISGNQGNYWIRAIADISEADTYSDVKIRFRGETGSLYTSDMAIDDIVIREALVCTPPVTQATNLSVTTINDNDMTLTWTSDGDHVILLAKEGSAVNCDPYSGDSYTANTNFTLGQDVGLGGIAVYSGTDETVTVTGLDPNTEYHFAIYKYNNADNCYNTTSPAIVNETTTGLCESYATSSLDSKIDAVIFNTINNNSSGTDCQTYTDYTHLSTDIEQGRTYSLSVTAGTCNGDYNKVVKVFIDWNNDNDFDDNAEQVYASTAIDVTTTHTTNITIPPIYIGSVSMRIVCMETSSQTSVLACGTYTYGETEDYTLNVIPIQPNISSSFSSIPFGEVVANTTSESKSVSVSGDHLTGNITVTAPANGSISLDNTDFSTNPISLTQVAGTVASTTIYTRYTPTSETAFLDTVKCESTGAETVYIKLSGTGVCSKFTTNPNDTTICQGESVTLTTVAEGSGLTYQWQKDDVNISGATSASYSISAVSATDVGDYKCIATSSCGSITSETASLSVNASTKITQQPQDKSAEKGTSVTFSVVAAGTNIAYQWQFNDNDINGETNSTCIINSALETNGGEYSVKVSGDCGIVTSNKATLVVTTSIEELSDYGINIYPNPSEGRFNVSYDNNIKAEVIIFNTAGTVVYHQKHASDNNSIDLSTQSEGVYFVKFIIDDHSIVSPIILR